MATLFEQKQKNWNLESNLWGVPIEEIILGKWLYRAVPHQSKYSKQSSKLDETSFNIQPEKIRSW